MTEQNERIIGKFIIQASIFNTTNLLVGSGKGETLDFEIIRENDEVIIPASGFVGMLRNYFYKYVDLTDGKLNTNALYFWGNTKFDEDNQIQSHLMVDDLICINPKPTIVVRDGVAINQAKGTAEHQGKYDYELIEPGAEFSLNIEITIRKGFDVETFKQIINFIISQGNAKKYKQGAFTSHGFGKLEWKYVKVYHFEFKKDADAWFDYCLSGKINKPCADLEKYNNLKPKDIKHASITGSFSIKNSLIIGASDDNLLENSLDKTHIKNSNGHPLITAKSIRGPIRHRAYKILNTINSSEYAKTLIDNLFGFVDENKRIAKKSRIMNYETVVDGANPKQIQPRIKIDRFTGGTMNSALLSSQPLWHHDETFEIRFDIEEYENEEIAIMLLVMKDLMNEDLPIGGEKAIGRGVLTGHELKVKINSFPFFELSVSQDGSLSLSEESKKALVEIEKWIENLSRN